MGGGEELALATGLGEIVVHASCEPKLDVLLARIAREADDLAGLAVALLGHAADVARGDPAPGPF